MQDRKPTDTTRLGFFHWLRYRFALKQNVKFHDGSDWNCTVAKLNFDHVLAKPLTTGRASSESAFKKVRIQSKSRRETQDQHNCKGFIL